MTDENNRHVAKIQHFYDMMSARMNDCVCLAIASNDHEKSYIYREKSVEINFLLDEYAKLFANCLYKEETD